MRLWMTIRDTQPASAAAKERGGMETNVRGCGGSSPRHAIILRLGGGGVNRHHSRSNQQQDDDEGLQKEANSTLLLLNFQHNMMCKFVVAIILRLAGLLADYITGLCPELASSK